MRRTFNFHSKFVKEEWGIIRSVGILVLLLITVSRRTSLPVSKFPGCLFGRRDAVHCPSRTFSLHFTPLHNSKCANAGPASDLSRSTAQHLVHLWPDTTLEIQEYGGWNAYQTWLSMKWTGRQGAMRVQGSFWRSCHHSHPGSSVDEAFKIPN